MKRIRHLADIVLGFHIYCRAQTRGLAYGKQMEEEAIMLEVEVGPWEWHGTKAKRAIFACHPLAPGGAG